jgi:putative acetyltransferase
LIRNVARRFRKSIFTLKVKTKVKKMNNSTVIRVATPIDAQHIHELHLAAVRKLCAPCYDPDVIEGWLEGRSSKGYLGGIALARVFVAELGSAIIGFCESLPGEIIAVYVDPLHAGTGVGALLLNQALIGAESGAAQSVKLESALNAVGFYKRFGFSEMVPFAMKSSPNLFRTRN